MRPWQVLALMSGTIIAIVMAFSSVSYNATLGTSEPAFRWLPLVTSSSPQTRHQPGLVREK